MTISTAHLLELARKAMEDRLDGEDWIGIDTDLACVIPSFANLIAACTPESIAALCDKADEAERLRKALTEIANDDQPGDELALAADAYHFRNAARAALSKGGE